MEESGLLQAARGLSAEPDHSDVGLLASRTVRNKFILFKLLSIWQFVMSA